MKWQSIVASLLVAAGICAAVFGLHSSSSAQDADNVRVDDSGEHLASLEIWGKWSPNEELTRQCNPAGRVATATWEFIRDEEAAKSVLAELTTLRASMGRSNKPNAARMKADMGTVYAAGQLKWQRGDRETVAQFVLLNLLGNPTIATWEPDRKDWETANYSFVRDASGDNDLLFIGGDQKSELFTAFKRVK
jgi:hypothetical protein